MQLITFFNTKIPILTFIFVHFWYTSDYNSS